MNSGAPGTGQCAAAVWIARGCFFVHNRIGASVKSELQKMRKRGSTPVLNREGEGIVTLA